MSQVLSQGEVDALLRGVSEGDVETETDEPDEVSGVVPYDLTSQEKIIRARLPTLDIITQMFFDFDRFRRFVEKAREIGIQVPIIPGIKPINSINQLISIPRYFHITIPHHMVEAMENARTKEQARKVAIEKVADLCRQLLDYGVPGLHIYTMGRGKTTRDLLHMLLG